MIEQIIVAYLQRNKRLVLPEFGAFIHKEEGNTLVFVPFLKKDDGVLEEQLRAGYGLSHAEAKSAIEEYILKIKQTLTSGRIYTIEHIGRLRLDDNGICYLEYNPDQKAAFTQGAISPKAAPQNDFTKNEDRTEGVRPITSTPITNTKASAENKTTVNDEVRFESPDTSLTIQPKVVRDESKRSVQSQPVCQPVVSRPAGAPRPSQSASARPGAQRGTVPPPRRPQQGRPPTKARPQKTPAKRADLVIIVAIIAALVALAVIIFSFVVNTGQQHKFELIPTTEQAAETPVTDSINTPVDAGN